MPLVKYFLSIAIFNLLNSYNDSIGSSNKLIRLFYRKLIAALRLHGIDKGLKLVYGIIPRGMMRLYYDKNTSR